jgi:DNA-binding XRE family transcriptional regulator
MNKLRQKRIAAGLTTTELALKSGISRKTLWKAETDRPVKPVTIIKIKQILGQ